jgi:enamine deaminase RidA (YjgF/YER057c/UK114 family)
MAIRPPPPGMNAPGRPARFAPAAVEIAGPHRLYERPKRAHPRRIKKGRRDVIKRSGGSEILHDVVAHNGVLNLAGVVADDLSQGMAGQAKQVFEQIDGLLQAHGSDRNHLLSALIFITDMKLKPEMNKAWQAWLKKEHLPTRATIGINDLGPKVLIEVVVTAAVK